MSELSIRIRRVTEDLKAIQRELSDAAGGPAQHREEVMEEMLNAEMVQEFKSAVDQMRHLLWAYIETQSQTRPEVRGNAIRDLRMQRVTEMLRVLQPTVAESREDDTPATLSFLEVVQSIANSAMDDHEKRKALQGK